jgi:Xaa-Pro dipeptidase
MSIDYQARIQKFLDMSGLEVFALIPGTNMIYFTGLNFHLGKRPLIGFFHRQGVTFLNPLLEKSNIENGLTVPHTLFSWDDTQGYKQALKDTLKSLGIQDKTMLGVDGYTMRVFEWLALAEGGANMANVRDVGRDLLMLRSIKTIEEVAWMQEAIHISEKSLAQLMDWVQVGMTEKQIAHKLAELQASNGAQGEAFESIVLVAERSALPHGNPGEHVLKENDILLVDFGCKINEYPSDITRTFVIGTPSDEFKKIHDTVCRANAAARAISKPGVSWGDVDKAARDVIVAAGYGEYFTHRTGHGLGMDGHELPQISSGETTQLEEGMVFTIEPGIYVPHIGGVRIEDNMVVTADGCISMTTFKREL